MLAEQHDIKYRTNLRDTTRKLLREKERKITFDQISQDTGIPYAWLNAFSLGRSKHPSVNYVQTLYEYLTGRQLEV